MQVLEQEKVGEKVSTWCVCKVQGLRVCAKQEWFYYAAGRYEGGEAPRKSVGGRCRHCHPTQHSVEVMRW